MKKISLLILLMPAVVMGEGMTWWGITSSDGADHVLATRLGWEKDQVEICLALNWWTAEPDWGPEPDAIGAAFIFHIDEYVAVTDPMPDSRWEQFMHAFVGRPYVGLEYLYDMDYDDTNLNWLVGTLISTDRSMKRALAIEYADGQYAAEDSESVLRLAFRIQF